MNNTIKEIIRVRLIESGAVAAGFAKASEISPECVLQYEEWLAAGKNAGMDYLARHAPLRIHPKYVLESAKTVISVAFNYHQPILRKKELPVIAEYAYGKDYHDVIRKKLTDVVNGLKNELGGDWRVCIDTAPIAERWWAIQSGIGRKGKNGTIIIDGFGTYCFLAEILTSIEIEADLPSGNVCNECGACIKVCPTGALGKDGTIDSRHCINYLTIEHKGEWNEAGKEAMHTSAGKKSLYGCDICRKVCPHNNDAVSTSIDEFLPNERILNISKEDIIKKNGETINKEDFSTLMKGSAMKRCRLEGMIRNAKNLD